jgi:HNH endonuclease
MKKGPYKKRPLNPLFYKNGQPKYVIDANGCWIWVAAVSDTGYGCASLQTYPRSYEQAHRTSWRIHRGPIPEGMDIDHLCRVRACINPEHLEPVAHTVNVRRGKCTKLIQGQVDEMRQMRVAGIQVKDIAEHFAMSRSHTSRVVRGIWWSNRFGCVCAKIHAEDAAVSVDAL